MADISQICETVVNKMNSDENCNKTYLSQIEEIQPITSGKNAKNDSSLVPNSKLEVNNTIEHEIITNETGDSKTDTHDVEVADNDVMCGKLNETVLSQQKILEQKEEKIKLLEEKCANFEKGRQDLERKLENAVKQKDLATKEKESMVIRYAVSEKNILKEKQLYENSEKKLKESVKENEYLQHKLQTMISEKSRICQMLDNKTYEHRITQQELEKTKSDFNNLETKLKWSQTSLKTEIENHRDCQVKLEALTAKLQDVNDQIETAKKDAENSIKAFRTSQDNKAHVLDRQVQEQQASLILLKHERSDRESQIKNLQTELERLQSKQKEMIQENNDLSLKVQQLERERSESEQKLSELRGCADQQRQDVSDLQAKTVQLEQLKLQLKHEQDQLTACNEQMALLKQRNSEVEDDMEACRIREAELLLFTQQLTDKNVRLQSEFTAMETKVQQLTCEQTLHKRQIKEQETKACMLTAKLSEERVKFAEESESLAQSVADLTRNLEVFKQEAVDQKGENVVLKRKFDLSFRELNKELQQCRKKIENFENMESTTSSSSSNSSLNVTDKPVEQTMEHVKADGGLDRQALLEHIGKLQRISAKKSEKMDFLEEHVNSLVSELQKKTRLLQGYILREQAGTLTSNSMDKNKAKLAKLNGVMASVYSSRVVDETLTLELSLDINRKLQAVLEDALLKNITLKENVDTLGTEIDRLNKLIK